jgi:hypothetical protein
MRYEKTNTPLYWTFFAGFGDGFLQNPLWLRVLKGSKLR